MLEYTVSSCMHQKRQKCGFTIDSDNRDDSYLFLHFINPIDITIDGKVIQTSSNACIIYPPGMHRHYTAGSVSMLHNFMHFKVSDPNEFMSLGIPIGKVFYTELQDRITGYVEFAEFFVAGYSRQESSGSDSRYTVDKTVHNLFSALAKEQKSGRIAYGKPLNVAFDELRTEIYKNPSDWNVVKMAQYVHLSRSYFSVRYHSVFAISPNEDLICAAIRYANRLFSTTHMSVAEVSEECGFSNSEYFISLYKKRTGITPGRYKKQFSDEAEEEPLPDIKGSQGI